MFIRFRDVDADEIEVTVESEPVVLELQDIVCKTNVPVEELKINLLTRLQGSNDLKNQILKRPPAYLQSALSELDALWKA